MKVLKVLAIVFLCIIVLLFAFFNFTPAGRTMYNNYVHSLQKSDEISYETKKMVEDTARAYISSYNSDVSIYRIYCNSEDTNEKNYANSARIRAVETANSYNEYLQKNSYVWSNNIPPDLPQTLETNIS